MNTQLLSENQGQIKTTLETYNQKLPSTQSAINSLNLEIDALGFQSQTLIVEQQQTDRVFLMQGNNEIQGGHPADQYDCIKLQYQHNQNFNQSTNQMEEQLQEEIAYLREENIILKQQLTEIKRNYESFIEKEYSNKPIYSNQDVNRLLEENNFLGEVQKKLSLERNKLRKQVQSLQQNLQDIAGKNQEYYKSIISLTNQLEKQRRTAKANLIGLQQEQNKVLQKERKKYNACLQELYNQRQENHNLQSIISEANQEIQKYKQMIEKLQDQNLNILREKDQLNELVVQKQEEKQQNENIRNFLQEKGQEVKDLRQQLYSLEQENKELIAQCQKLKNLYQSQLSYQQQSDQLIRKLTLRIEQFQRQAQHKSISNNPLNNNNRLYNRQNPMHNKTQFRSSTCSGSSINRIKVLCNQSSRKTIMQELKRWLKEISKIDLQNKILSLAQELYMDAEYRQRTNMQMQQMIVQLENKISLLQMGRKMEHPNQAYNNHLQISLERYQKLLQAADTQKLQLIQEISLLKKENYQIRLQLANSQMDNETEQLIEQLTLQLEQQKHNGKVLQEQNEVYKEEIRNIQKQLNEKNKKIKLLTLNLNKKYIEHQSKSPF